MPTRTREPSMPRTTIFPLGMRTETTAPMTATSPSPTQCGAPRPTSVGESRLATKPTSEACKPTERSKQKTAPPLTPSPMAPPAAQWTPLPWGRVTQLTPTTPLREAQMAYKPTNDVACGPAKKAEKLQAQIDSDEETERLLIKEQEKAEKVEILKKKEEL